MCCQRQRMGLVGLVGLVGLLGLVGLVGLVGSEGVVSLLNYNVFFVDNRNAVTASDLDKLCNAIDGLQTRATEKSKQSTSVMV